MLKSSTIRAILLDFDGTLVDTEFLHHDCWRLAVEPLGLTVEWDDYVATFVGISDRKAARILAERAGMDPAVELLDRLCESKHRCYRARSPKELRLDDDVRRCLGEASQTLPLAVVSSSPIVDVEPLLHQTEVREFFQFLVCGEDVTYHKPHPEPYLLALEKFRQRLPDLQPDQCLVFEDSSSGVQSATAAGMTVRQVTSPGRLPSLLQDVID